MLTGKNREREALIENSNINTLKCWNDHDHARTYEHTQTHTRRVAAPKSYIDCLLENSEGLK